LNKLEILIYFFLGKSPQYAQPSTDQGAAVQSYNKSENFGRAQPFHSMGLGTGVSVLSISINGIILYSFFVIKCEDIVFLWNS